MTNLTNVRTARLDVAFYSKQLSPSQYIIQFYLSNKILDLTLDAISIVI